jgi:hypothetical protein
MSCDKHKDTNDKRRRKKAAKRLFTKVRPLELREDPQMRTILPLLALTLCPLVSAPAFADEIPACEPVPGIEIQSFQNDTPPAIKHVLTETFGPVAPPGAPFTSTDVAIDPGLPKRRVIFVWALGSRWVIATEHGGRGYNDPVLAFDLSPDRENAKLVGKTIAFPNTVCAAAHKMLVLKP